MTRRSRMAIGPPELLQLAANCWLSGMSMTDTIVRLKAGPVQQIAIASFYFSFEHELNATTKDTIE